MTAGYLRNSRNLEDLLYGAILIFYIFCEKLIYSQKKTKYQITAGCTVTMWLHPKWIYIEYFYRGNQLPTGKQKWQISADLVGYWNQNLQNAVNQVVQ